MLEVWDEINKEYTLVQNISSEFIILKRKFLQEGVSPFVLIPIEKAKIRFNNGSQAVQLKIERLDDINIDVN